MDTNFLFTENETGYPYKYDFSASLNILKNEQVSFDNLNSKFDNSLGEIINLYLCLMYADVPEKMAFPEIKGAYKKIENIVKNLPDKCLFLWYDPLISVYSGNYDFAKELIRTAGNFRIESLIESNLWEFTDFITDKGKNQKHSEILIDLLTRDYIEGGNNLFYYCGRYGSNELETCDECLERAVREINDVDLIFEKIKSTLLRIHLKSPFSDQLIDKQKINERVLDVLKKCTKLGYKLKTFSGFSEIFIPESKCISEDNDFGMFCAAKEIDLTVCIAGLVGENTVVDLVDADTCNFVIKDKKRKSKYINQFEYVGIYFMKKYGHKLIAEVKTPECLYSMSDNCYDLIEFKLTEEFMRNVYSDTKKLKFIVKKGCLSKNNIEEISGYFAERVSNIMDTETLNKLNWLNKLLAETGAVRNE